MSNQRYNGWKNWETWNLNLWIGNDEALYNYVIDECRSQKNKRAITKDFTKTLCCHIFRSGETSDGASLKKVDWGETSRNFKEMAFG